MTNHEAALRGDCSREAAVLYMGIELSKKEWKVAFAKGPTKKPHLFTIAAGDFESLDGCSAKAQERLGLPENTAVISCYEAGRDGFWVHRALEQRGVANMVVDPSSIKREGRKKKKKTDRLDARKLQRELMHFVNGDTDTFSVVRVPTVEQEDRRRRERELERLKKERTAHRSRLKGLLATHGVKLELSGVFEEQLEEATFWNEEPISPRLKAELRREYVRLNLVELQVDEIHNATTESLKQGKEEADKKTVKLAMLKGVGVVSSVVLVDEAFGWREFKNRKEAGGYTGLTGTPWASGDDNREQGISKAGNKRLRRVLVELAWCWVRWQPNSSLTKWFNERFAHGSTRFRRIGIVAVARKLFIALWRYVEHDVVPEGATLKLQVRY